MPIDQRKKGATVNIKIEFVEVLSHSDGVKATARKAEKSEAKLLDHGTGNLLRAIKQKMLKKRGCVDYGKLRKDGYSNRFLAHLEEA